jgi:hypothetical protein
MFCTVLSYSQNVVSGMAVEKARRRVDEEREQHLVRFGEIEGALQGDRPQQERCHHPGPVCPGTSGEA